MIITGFISITADWFAQLIRYQASEAWVYVRQDQHQGSKISEKAYAILVLHLQLVTDFSLLGKDPCVTDLGLVGRKGTTRDVRIS